MGKGKHLPSIRTKHYKNTAACETEYLPIPDVVRICMSQNIGAPCKPLVAKGDYVKVGQKIGDTDAFVSAPIYSSVSGTVKGIEEARSSMGGKETHIVIETDKKQEVCEGIAPPVVTNREEFLTAVRESGVVGLGGASFPTHVKFKPNNLDECDVLVINGAECESFITADNRMMVEQTQDIIDGMVATMKYLELERGIVGVEENKPDAIEALRNAAKQNGIDNITVHVLPPTYPKGAERVLVYETTGRVMRGGVLPAQLGVILCNVSTIATIGQYLRTGMPLIRKRLTIDGDAITTPKNVYVPIGTQVADIIEFCGGYKVEPRKMIMGGPMMGRPTYTDAIPIVKSSNAVICFSEEMAQVKKETACINCGRCHQACPFGLLPQMYAEAYKRRDVESMKKYGVMECMACNSCSYVCPARRPLALTNDLCKAMVKEAASKK